MYIEEIGEGYAKCEKDGKATCYYTVDIYDNLGTRVASAVTTGFHIAK